MLRHEGKAALVTGAGHGIGRAIAARLGREGARVAVLEIDEVLGRESCALLQSEGVSSYFVRADLTEASETAQAVAEVEERLGPFDILVNNAAFTELSALREATAERWTREIDINLNGAYHAIAATLPYMAKRKSGAIVMINSVNGMRYFGNPAYSAAKAGSISLTMAIATEYGPHGIRCNAVCPGSVRTDAVSWQARLKRDPEVFEKLARWYPLGRVAMPDDIAKAVSFLASDEAGYITGAVLPVDGGLLAGMKVMIEDINP